MGDFGLQFAFGFNQLIGLSLEGNLSFGESFDREDSDLRYALKGGLDFNFKRRYNVPLGLIVGYSMISQPELVYTDEGTALITSFKLTYTGTSDFLIGLESGLMSIPLVEVDQKSNFLATMFSVRYYFN
ncbi:MAG: hypothetical protein KFF73_14840 [Cyclobacteriaceae bacterium]|nr:hypothetical protein [Cyclobacteriaceae bacterium]